MMARTKFALFALLLFALAHPSLQECASGWVSRADEDGSRHCYNMVFGSQRSQQAAMTRCNALFGGARLASLDSASERAFIDGHVAPFDSLWIDGRYDVATGEWLVHEGTPSESVASLFWNAESPDNYGGGERCIEFSGSDGLFNDMACSIALDFVCEYVDATPVVSPPSLVVGDYATNPAVVFVGEAAALAPSFSVDLASEAGATLSFSVSPALPEGLSLDASTGVISGIPIASARDAVVYTVTASYSGITTVPDEDVALTLAVWEDGMCQMMEDHAHLPASADWSRHGYLDRYSLQCVCESGFSSNDTTELNCFDHNEEVCPRPAIEPLVTTNVALLDATRTAVSSGELTITVAAPIAENRLLTDIELGPREDLPAFDGSSYGGPGARRCHYTSDFWRKTGTVAGFDAGEPCNDLHEGVIPWSHLTRSEQQEGCGLFPIAETDVSGNEVWRYEGQLRAFVDDVVGEIRGQPIYRHTQALMKFHVDAPLSVSVTVGNVAVSAPIAVIAAITRQVYAFNATNENTGVGVVHVYTSVQWPFELQAASLSDPSGQYSVQAVRNPEEFGVHLPAGGPLAGVEYTQCDETEGSVCWQTFEIEYFPQDERCELDSTPRIEFDIVCRGDPSACPLQGETAAVDMEVDSEDFCADLALETGLTASMSIHESFAAGTFGPARIAFLDGQTLYAQINTISPDLPLASTSIHRVELMYQNADGSLGALAATMFDLDACAALAGVCPQGVAANYVELGVGGAVDTAGFQLDVSTGAGGLFQQIGFDEIEPVAVRVLIDVTYSAGGPAARSAIVIRLDDGVSRSEVSAGFALDFGSGSGNDPELTAEGGPDAQPRGGVSLVLLLAVGGAAMLALVTFFVLLVVVRRRRKDEKEGGETRPRSDSQTPLSPGTAAAVNYEAAEVSSVADVAVVVTQQPVATLAAVATQQPVVARASAEMIV